MINQIIRNTIPIAPLKLIIMDNSIDIGQQVNSLLVEARQKKYNINPKDMNLIYLGYDCPSYLVDFDCPRFGSGEAKAVIHHAIRGTDVFILSNMVNFTTSYTMYGEKTTKSPDDHFQDLKRVIAACNGQAHRINVIMPFLYGSHQIKRLELESLDCSMALQELVQMGVKNIITFDANDARVQNALPIQGFDNYTTVFQFIREMVTIEPKLQLDSNNLIIISPNEEGMSRCVYYANVLGVNAGMFYKKSNNSTNVESGKSAINYEYLGNPVTDKNVLIVSHMISSGDSLLEIAKELKNRGARNIYIAATFGLFTNGFDKFDESYDQGILHKLFTTNLTDISPELTERPYYHSINLSKYMALIIDTLNHNTSVNEILDPSSRIQELKHQGLNG